MSGGWRVVGVEVEVGMYEWWTQVETSRVECGGSMKMVGLQAEGRTLISTVSHVSRAPNCGVDIIVIIFGGGGV